MLVFNPAAIMSDGKIYLLYRALGKEDQISRLGLATSTDGIHFDRQQYPAYYGDHDKFETLGIEDPRVVKIDDTFYLVYTAVSEDKTAIVNPNWKENFGKMTRIGLSTTKDFVDYLDDGIIIPDIAGKNASLFPKKVNGEYWLLFRDDMGMTKFAKSPRFDYWPETYPLFTTRAGFWDSKRIGIGAPPIETEKGWLLFYHGVDEKNVYRLGIIFLDLEDPRKMLYRSPEPIFEPETDYEKVGFIPNVVFTCGAVEKDEKYFVYYGAADMVIGLATVEKKEVLSLF
jgi:predicted GH43/DUF377 family glycosyl hydrolase